MNYLLIILISQIYPDLLLTMSGEIERVRDDIEGWFKDRGLAWNERIKVALMEYGVEFTEHLKVLPKDEWMALFSDQPLVPKKLAEIVFQHLKGEKCVPTKCATRHPIKRDSHKSTTTDGSHATSSRTMRENSCSKQLGTFGFTRVLPDDMTAAAKKARREAQSKAAPTSRYVCLRQSIVYYFILLRSLSLSLLFSFILSELIAQIHRSWTGIRTNHWRRRVRPRQMTKIVIHKRYRYL